MRLQIYSLKANGCGSPNSPILSVSQGPHLCSVERQVCGEKQRFEKLMEHFRNEDNNIDFMVACMQFINIVVHSVEDMNFRVHLQYEFTKLGLDEYLDVSTTRVPTAPSCLGLQGGLGGPCGHGDSVPCPPVLPGPALNLLKPPHPRTFRRTEQGLSNLV
ncbi:hypothetical protein llap_19831 [Limosa lapponica baueri]|uniref:Formin FH3 domain-containing protein n=1 Tax=Limosa lapponica baueri TaxID=1758121 RepID=A0A2I0T7S7_LIMLA|nr:hypothetical protein llap_19831 [Limosa lapponica baueri]